MLDMIDKIDHFPADTGTEDAPVPSCFRLIFGIAFPLYLCYIAEKGVITGEYDLF